ncbi:class I adenylate-forming enzyme family protein [Rhodococcus sp. NPDC056743]|uniref:class I adenylate-forming enzyme family protein n=1 Tax=Rhodococcus sp. NPDC056743 TaxID=3345934 RepID=UPI00366FD0D6
MTMPAQFDAAVATAAARIAVQYFDRSITYRELDDLVSGLAHYLRTRGIVAGARVAIYLQSSPEFVITTLAAWRAGCVVVPVNPMYRDREILELLLDSGASALISSEAGYTACIAGILENTDLRVVLTCDESAMQRRNDPRVFDRQPSTSSPAPEDLLTLARAHYSPQHEFEESAYDDLALICYTSGTSGPSKGAMLTHRNLSTNIESTVQILGLARGSRIFAMAPLFHVTGLVVEFLQSIALAGTLILPYRFDPAVALDLFLEYRPHFAVGPCTAYSALLATPGVHREHFRSFEILLAGGAPLPPPLVDAFESLTGHYIINGYGLTETSAACVLMPIGQRAPVDSATSALANGYPFPGVELRIVDEAGADLPVGERGEIVIRGPLTSSGYWNKPEETAAAFRNGWFFTGDIGLFDHNRLLYVVDRKKDMIIASGFKVWPGEVEFVLYTHPDVREAAVVGIPDEYRGEAVKAYVALVPGARATEHELVEWCRDGMAAYKYPRSIEILTDLPKTASGKILRRALH